MKPNEIELMPVTSVNHRIISLRTVLYIACGYVMHKELWTYSVAIEGNQVNNYITKYLHTDQSCRTFGVLRSYCEVRLYI